MTRGLLAAPNALLVVLGTVALLGCGSTGDSGAAATSGTGDASAVTPASLDGGTMAPLSREPPKTKFASGTRLQVEYWVHGALSMPWRFWDTAFDLPCDVVAFGGSKYCVPHTESDTPRVVGFSDMQCTRPAVAMSVGLSEGDIVIGGTPTLAAYRVGALIEDGPIFTMCQGGFSVPSEVQPRRALVPIETSELVRFETMTVQANTELSLVWLHGADGSWQFQEARRGSDTVCLPKDALCLLNQTHGAQVVWFSQGYADDACTQPAVHGGGGVITSCGSEGTLLFLQNECQDLSLYGRIGSAVSGPFYRKAPDGTCAALDSPAMPSPTLSECQYRLDPIEPEPATFDDEVTKDGELELHETTVAGGTIVGADFTLSDSATPCAPARLNGVVRCLPPLRSVAGATDADGTGGHLVDHDVCPALAQGSSPSVPLFTFAAGAPCLALVSHGIEVSSASAFGGIPIVQGVDRFVPHKGKVFRWSIVSDNYVCEELPAAGFYTTVPIPAGTFPELHAERR